MNKKLLLYFALLLWFVVPTQAQPTILGSELTIDPNGIAEIDVTTRDIESLLGLQFAIDWNKEVLNFLSIENFALPAAGSNNYNISNSGKLRIQWEGNTYFIENDVPLFTLRFQAIGQPNDSSLIEFTDDSNAGGTPFITEVIDGTANLVDVVFEHGAVQINDVMSNNNIVPSNLALYQNAPNPFQNQTQIIFELQTADKLTLSVINTNGQEVFKHTAKYTVGQHHMKIDNKDLPATGLYIYKISGEQSGEFSKKMFFNK